MSSHSDNDVSDFFGLGGFSLKQHGTGDILWKETDLFTVHLITMRFLIHVFVFERPVPSTVCAGSGGCAFSTVSHEEDEGQPPGGRAASVLLPFEL